MPVLEPLVVAICDRKSGYQKELERRLVEESINYLCVFIKPFSWRLRILKTLDVARACPDRPLVFVDAWDTLLLGTKAELVAWFEGHSNYVVLAASKKCWPDVDRYIDYNVKQVGQNVSAWRYVNSNPMAGLGHEIAQAMERVWERAPLVGDSSDTQEPNGEVCERFYTTMYLDNPRVRVDSSCRLNQIFLCSTPGDLYVADGRIHNLKTGSMPIFLHLNGQVQFPLELLS